MRHQTLARILTKQKTSMSKATYTHDIVATVGEYTLNNETKKRYQKCGIAFTNEDGGLSLKMEAMPITPDWSGWLSLYPKKEYDNQPRQQQNRPPAEPVRQQPAAAAADPNQDDIPF